MRLLVVGPLGELAHRSLARFAGIGDVGRHARALEQHALRGCRSADTTSSLRFEPREHFGRDREAGRR